MRRIKMSLISMILFLLALFAIIPQSLVAKNQEFKGVEGKDYVIYKYPTGIDVVLTPSVSYDSATGFYKYEYKLYSKPTSKQDIWTFDIEVQVPVEEIKAPSNSNWVENWDGEYKEKKEGYLPDYRYSVASWVSGGKPTHLRPNQTLEGFSYQSRGIPGIATSYTEGWQIPMKFPEGMAVPAIYPKGAKSPFAKGKTIGPVPLPDEPVDPVAFAFRLENLTRQAGKLGWIKSETLTNKWATMLDGIKDYYPDKSRVKDTLNVLITELESQRGKQIDDNAYYLLKLNAEFLLRKL